MGLHDEAKLDRKFTEFAKQMNLYLNHFPKHEKYGLAQPGAARWPASSPSLGTPGTQPACATF